MKIKKFIRHFKNNLHIFKGNYHYQIYTVNAMGTLPYPQYKEVYSFVYNDMYYSLEYFEKNKKLITVIMFTSNIIKDIENIRKLVYNFQIGEVTQ